MDEVFGSSDRLEERDRLLHGGLLAIVAHAAAALAALDAEMLRLMADRAAMNACRAPSSLYRLG